jgi:hypothetical protein
MSQHTTNFKDHEHEWHTLSPVEVLKHFEVQGNYLPSF